MSLDILSHNITSLSNRIGQNLMLDRDIRKVIKSSILKDPLFDSQSKIVDELKICNGRTISDVALINGCLSGFEIKSERDNLSRLSEQITNYNKVFDFVTVVTNHKHLTNVSMEIPKWWGIWLVQTNDNVPVKIEVRPAEANKQTDPFSIAQFLWKEELVDLIIRRGLNLSMKNKRKWLVWEYISEELNLVELQEEVRSYLKNRVDWKVTRIKEVNQ